MNLRDLPSRVRFHSRERFSLSAGGRRAEASYRSLIVASRSEPGRDSFDAARSAWARALDLQPDDGAYLGELLAGAVNLTEITEAMAVCGKTRADAVTSLGRLVDAGLVLTAPRD